MSWIDEWYERWEQEGLLPDDYPLDELPNVYPNDFWEVTQCWRLTAHENQPGLSMFYIYALDSEGKYLPGVAIEFKTEPPATGVIFDHPNVWGYTGSAPGREGYAEWRHPRVPTRYEMYVDGKLLIANLRTDLGDEYDKPSYASYYMGNRPVNRPGVYSWKIVIKQK